MFRREISRRTGARVSDSPIFVGSSATVARAKPDDCASRKVPMSITSRPDGLGSPASRNASITAWSRRSSHVRAPAPAPPNKISSTQLVRICKPIARTLRERLVNNGLKLLRHVRHDLTQRPRRLTNVAQSDRQWRLSSKWHAAREHLVQNYSEAVNI